MSYITQIIRDEREELKKEGWTLLYGRRKVGKTYLLRNLYQPDYYILVKKDRSLWSEELEITTNTLSGKVNSLLKENKKIVIDEFQRLDQSLLEEIVTSHPKGKLILSGSSLRVVNKILSQQSPFLGFFSPLKLGLISPENMIQNLAQQFDAEKTIELSTFLRDPWLISFYSGEEPEKFLFRILTQFQDSISSLVGETFTEEDRELSDIYEALLSLIGSGKWKAKDMASVLYNRGLIKEPGSSGVNQYLKNMRNMDLVNSYKLYGSRSKYNRLKSPIMQLFYYLEDRYNISEREVSYKELEPTLDTRLNFEIENFFADLFAGFYGGKREYLQSKDKEIDFVITQRNDPVCVGEVKWGEVNKRQAEHFLGQTGKFGCDKVMIGKKVSDNLKETYPEVEFYDSEGMVDEIVSSQ